MPLTEPQSQVYADLPRWGRSSAVKNSFHSRASRASASGNGSTERRPSVADEIETFSRASAVSISKSAETPNTARQQLLDPRIECLARERRCRRQQAVIGEQRFLPVLILRLADHVAEDAGIIVDVAVVDVVGELLLMDQRLAVEISPLPQQEGAQREQAAERGQRLLHVVVAHRAGRPR